MASNEAPDIVVGRLPIYLRALTFMAEEGREITSSQELSEKLGISSAQIRKDLSHFGEFGKQGTGYEIAYLRDQLKRILHVERTWPVALVGYGDLGHALANYGGFRPKGFEIVALFDNAPHKIGQEVAGKKVIDLAELPTVVREKSIKVAIVAVPSSGAQGVADMLVESGIKAILNYAPINISVPPEVQVQYIDPAAHLQHMTYYLA
jgi:redox-sensing transcriptional repressor